MFSVIIGGISGILFGNLFDYQTLLSGYITGIMMGIMRLWLGLPRMKGYVLNHDRDFHPQLFLHCGFFGLQNLIQ
ncbi:hypothetical protein JCM21738_4442 [Mesobacillus boroniphilus JCM 21738]|uniref:Uncharacterized protein n=1 Tax=Mesobacillus boroniphilus JCM 21738 TaxID=1294265 RepID=W4RTP5_9BACI|nr:hypothetical protein JCM21738_4442 [Mesobacillus boroniphilus JCM 21738]